MIYMISRYTMVFYNSVIILAFIACVASKIDPPFNPCGTDDIKCIRSAKQNLFSKTAEGVEELDIKPIDPLTISSVEVDDTEVALHFTNTSVAGLKDLKISNFKLDNDKNMVQMEIICDLIIASNIGVEIKKEEKTLNGHYTAKATVTEEVEYNHSVVDINGTDYFEFGVETSNCEIVDEPTVSLKVTIEDDDDKETYAKMPTLDKTALRKKTICRVMTVATGIIMQNLRAAARAFPKSAFIKDDTDDDSENENVSS